jgi:hypothetical protein
MDNATTGQSDDPTVISPLESYLRLESLNKVKELHLSKTEYSSAGRNIFFYKKTILFFSIQISN